MSDLSASSVLGGWRGDDLSVREAWRSVLAQSGRVSFFFFFLACVDSATEPSINTTGINLFTSVTLPCITSHVILELTPQVLIMGTNDITQVGEKNTPTQCIIIISGQCVLDTLWAASRNRCVRACVLLPPFYASSSTQWYSVVRGP